MLWFYTRYQFFNSFILLNVLLYSKDHMLDYHNPRFQHVGTIEAIKCLISCFIKETCKYMYSKLYMIYFLINLFINVQFIYILFLCHCFPLLERYWLPEDISLNICIIHSKPVLQKDSHLLYLNTAISLHLAFRQEEFEDTKGTIRIRLSKTTQWPKEKYKRKTNDLQNIQIKLKIE